MLNQIFMEKQEPQVQRATTEEGKTQQDIYIQEIAKKKKYDFVARSTTFIVKEENLFQKFAKLIIETAKKAGRKTYPILSMKSGMFRCPILWEPLKY